jgi:hypothetical protein
MKVQGYAIGIGFVIALVVLVLGLVLWATDNVTRDWLIGLICALAVARMVP